MNITNKTILKQFTVDTGVSQKEVAVRLKYSPQRVNNYYRDMAEAPFEFLNKFGTEFSVDLRKQLDKESKGVAAGAASFNSIPVFDLDLKPVKELNFFDFSELVIYYIDAPLYNDCFAAVRVLGAAMSPNYNPSDVIAIKRVTNFETIPLGEPYFIITEEQRLLRYIRLSRRRSKEDLPAQCR